VPPSIQEGREGEVGQKYCLLFAVSFFPQKKEAGFSFLDYIINLALVLTRSSLALSMSSLDGVGA